MTAHVIKGRVLGQSREVSVENCMTFFITGNGCTISPDLRRRVLITELFLREARPEDRKIRSPMDDDKIRAMRGEILSALWTLVKEWSCAGSPKPKVSHNSFPAWANMVGGVLEHAGFASPCTPAVTQISGDRDTEDMEKLVTAMAERYPRQDLKPGAMYDFCREIGVFGRLVGDSNDEMEQGKRVILSKVFNRFDGRVFSGGKMFRINNGTKHTRAYYVEQPK
jgi:hypothetical protein